MARHGSGGSNGGGGTGIEGITPPTGPVTAFLGLGLFVAAVWLTIKHPASAFKALGVGALVTLLLMSSGTFDANPIQHPFIGLLVIGLGFACAPDKSQDNKKGTKRG